MNNWKPADIVKSNLDIDVCSLDFICNKSTRGNNYGVKIVGTLEPSGKTIIKKGSIILKDGKLYELTKDAVYDSPSKAVHKCIVANRIYWQTEFTNVDTGFYIGKYYFQKSAMDLSKEEAEHIKEYWRTKVYAVKHNISYKDALKELKEYSKVDEAKIADKSLETNSLAESAKKEASEIAETVVDKTFDTKFNSSWDKKRQEEQELIEQQRRDLEYVYNEVPVFLNNPLLINTENAKKALDLLNIQHTLYITGASRSGKTYLTKYIAGKFTDKYTENIDKEAFNKGLKIVSYENLLWVDCGVNYKEFCEIFAKFCTHNISTTNCLVVFNEADVNRFKGLIPFWEQMDCDGKSFKDFVEQDLYFIYNDMQIQVPKNLRIIANIADSEYDKQMENRFGNRLDLDIISTSTENIRELSSYTGMPEEIIEILIKTQNILLKEWKDPKNKQAFFIPYHLKYKPYETLIKYKDKVNLIYAGDISESDVATLENYINSIKLKDVNNED